ncbi:MAG: MBL fold metallo-hydrolase [Coriobacteriales bacterium]
MNISVVKVGPIQTNCYIVSSGGQCLVIDPGAQPQRILTELRGAKPVAIVLTHNHWDHTGAVPALVRATGAPVMAHRLDAPGVFGLEDNGYVPRELVEDHRRALEEGMTCSRLLETGDAVELGGLRFEVLHTPGHTPGSICLYCAQEKALFAGDTLFAGGRFGRTDFEGGSMEAMVSSLGSAFAAVPDDVAVYSGHEKSSTMAAERALNPYLR